MGVIGESKKRHSRFKFLVEIDGFGSAAFQSCTPPEAEFGVQEYFEGGSLIPDKQPGRLTYSDVTLERSAVSGDTDAYNWFVETANVAANAGLVSPQYKRNVDIVQLDRDNSELRRWTLFNAWARKFTAGEFDGTSDDVTLESVVLAYDYFELSFEAGA